jgi:ArsR family transcriptional regulator
MLTLLGPRAGAAVGIDLSQQMLNIARRNVASAGLERVELRHGDIFSTRLPSGEATWSCSTRCSTTWRPAAAIGEAARLVAPGGRLLVVDFAPHGLEFLGSAPARAGSPTRRSAAGWTRADARRPSRCRRMRAPG